MAADRYDPTIQGWAMGVFGGAVETQTQTQKNVYATEAAEPDFGSLNPKAMTSTTALAGTTGVDCMVIHGNVDSLVEMNMKLHVEQSFTELTDADHKNTVTGNKTQAVVGVTNQTFTGHHEQTNIATRTDHFIHQRTELHSQPEMVHQPTETCEHVKEKTAEQGGNIACGLASRSWKSYHQSSVSWPASCSTGISFVSYDASTFVLIVPMHYAGMLVSSPMAL